MSLSPHTARLGLVVVVASSASLVLGLLAFAGWVFDVHLQQAVAPAVPAMKPNTAAAIAALAVSTLIAVDLSGRWARLGVVVLAGFAAFLASGAIVEHAGVPIRSGEWLVAVNGEPGAGDPPGQMSFATAVALVALGASAALSPRLQRSVVQVRQGLAVAGGMLGAIGFITVMLDPVVLMAVAPFRSMAPFTSASLCLLAIAQLASMPQAGLVHQVLRATTGGRLLRRSLVLMGGGPLVLAIVLVNGVRWGWFGWEFGLAFQVMGSLLLASLAAFGLSAYADTEETAHRRADRELAEQASRALEANMERAAIVEYAPMAILTATPERVVTSWNPAAERLMGWTSEEVIGQVSPMVPEPALSEAEALMSRVSSGEAIRGQEVERVRKDGTHIDLMISFAPGQPLPDGRRNVIIVAADITRRKEAERAAAVRSERLAALRSIDLAITSTRDRHVSLGVVLDQARVRLGVDAASILRLDPDSLVLQHEASRGFVGTGIQRTRLRLGQGYAGTAALEGRTVLLSDVRSAQPEFVRQELLDVEGFNCYAVAPLLAGGRSLGVLEVFNRNPMTCNEDWVSFLEALAGQAAIALESADLFEHLQRSNSELFLSYEATLEGWVAMLDLRDHETEGHSVRVADLTVRVARALGMDGDDLTHLRRGALLHDVGKLAVPDSVLLKPGPLDEDERQVMSKHPDYAYRFLKDIPYLRRALDIPYGHHERWDGTGYPRGLRGSEIPLGARIFAVVDVWDALSSDRPYRAAWSLERVEAHIRSGIGTHFDPAVVEAALPVLRRS